MNYCTEESNKEFKKFVSRHSQAYIEWEMLSRADSDDVYEIPLCDFLDMISRDYQWYTTFLNNIKVRLRDK
tara:strand:- start:244 stop:456 length:213 start_codon:yes stop_codon:yes gene_type:complete